MSGGLLDAGNTVWRIGAHLSDLLVAPEACYPYLELFSALSSERRSTFGHESSTSCAGGVLIAFPLRQPRLSS